MSTEKKEPLPAYDPNAASAPPENVNNVDLSKFKDVIATLNNLQMFTSYFPIFIQHNVDDEAVVCLEKEEIKELIPKIGDRARFVKWLNSYKQKHKGLTISPLTKKTKSCSVCNGNKEINKQVSYKDIVSCKNCNGSGSVSVQRSRQTETDCKYCDPKGSGKKLIHSECWGYNPHQYKRTGTYDKINELPHPKKYYINAENCPECVAASANCYVCEGTGKAYDTQYYYESSTCSVCNGAKTESSTKYRDEWISCGYCNGTGVEI
eukprot:421819_1